MSILRLRGSSLLRTMQVAALILLFGVAFVTAYSVEFQNNGCPLDTSIHHLLPHENCNQFYQCVHGHRTALTCDGSLLYNSKIQVCDWPQNVDCGERIIPKPEEDVADVESELKRFFVNPDNKLDDAKATCAHKDSEGLFIEHQLCRNYYRCSGGLPVELTCPSGLFFNHALQTCDFRLSVDCGERTA